MFAKNLQKSLPLRTFLTKCAFLIFFFCFRVCAVEIAITLDDHPMGDGALFSLDERTERYIEAFEAHECSGAFFCVGSNCRNLSEFTCLSRLDDAGHFLANHSYNHHHLSSMTAGDFVLDLEAAEAIFAPYRQFRKWFRFPYLDYGNREAIGGSEEKTRHALAVLKELGYEEGYVTMNTFDWYINSLLQKAVREDRSVDYAGLKRVYLTLLEEWCRHYIKVYREDIVHVLLLHANDLNALFLDEILKMISDNGWNLVSPDKAFTSPSWREEMLRCPQLVPIDPASLNCQIIDSLLEQHSVISK